LPATARRNDEVVKRCRPAAQGLFEAARDRPRGLAALAKRLADMQEKSRRMCSVQVWLANSNNTAFCYKYWIGSPLLYPSYLQTELWVNLGWFQTFSLSVFWTLISFDIHCLIEPVIPTLLLAGTVCRSGQKTGTGTGNRNNSFWKPVVTKGKL
jgi:hypothetical protein